MSLQIGLGQTGGAASNAECAPVLWTNNFTALSDGCGATGSALVLSLQRMLAETLQLQLQHLKLKTLLHRILLTMRTSWPWNVTEQENTAS